MHEKYVDNIIVLKTNIAKRTNTQEKLVLLLQCIPGRIHYILAAVLMNLFWDFARQHDEAIMNAVPDLGTLYRPLLNSNTPT